MKDKFYKANILNRLVVLGLILILALGGCGNSNNEPPSESGIESSVEEQVATLLPNLAPTSAVIPTSTDDSASTVTPASALKTKSFDLSTFPAYSGSPYVAINNNIPYFTDSDLTTTSFEDYSNLDSLGRCGVCTASVGRDIIPTEERGSIGLIKPSGWHTVKYNGIIDGNYLYNRCHLIGYQLTGENANLQNLITGTRYLNVEGMLPFENMVADYVKETNNHVMYRVTPVFEGDNLVASGVLMEAKSVEDSGNGVLFCVYCYNVQPQISIDYATGESTLSGDAVQRSSSEVAGAVENQVNTSDNNTTKQSSMYILNNNTKKFHLPNCESVNDIKEKNKEEYIGTRDELITRGYDPCKRSNP